ncbi:TonB-dependent receptor domain-containing protein [Pelagerythrobacter rhizovicinus]|nr:TonB-dependent receptor [Pelagerythrobacter rhizovicinus]
MRKHGLRYTCALSALALGLAGASPAVAQDESPDGAQSPPPENPVIVVTGSLIRGTPEDAALPVEVISQEELVNQGSPTALDLIKNLPGSSGVLGDSNQFDSRSQGSEGVSTVNLRGLGPSRTLVLLNGQRLANTPIGVPSVDVNLLPSAAIGRIEVLKDGAAATYGSDAIGGVVNFITNKQLEGLVLSGDYRFIDGSDGDWTASGAFGHDGDGLRVLASFGYQHRSPLAAIERDFAIRPYTENPAGGFTQGGSPGAFLPFAFYPGTFVGVTSDFQVDRGCDDLGGIPVANSTPTDVDSATRCATQYTPFDLLVEKEDRWQAYLETEIDLTDQIVAEFSGLLGHTSISANTSPSYLILNTPTPGLANPIGSQFWVPPNNPGLIAYREANPDQFPSGANSALLAAGVFRTALLGGNPLFRDQNGIDGAAPATRDSESMRFTGAVRGSHSAAFNWELSGTWHKYIRESTGYDSIIDRVQLALRGLGGEDCDPLTGTPGVGPCMFYNPFSNAIESNAITGEINPGYDPAVANDPAVFDYFTKKSSSRISNELKVANLVFSGNTGIALGGGNGIGYALGAQYRHNGYDARYGPYNDLTIYPCPGSLDFGVEDCARPIGLFGFLGSDLPNASSQDVFALFGELQIPIGDRVDIQLAARYEDYGGAVGSTFDPKASARVQITDWLALRGSYQTTFRAPPSNILTAGDYLTSLQFVGGSFRAVRVNDNPTLVPESAESYGGGVLLDFGGFRASVDYWRYDFSDDIVAEPLSGILNSVFDSTLGSSTPGTAVADCSNPLASRFTFSGGPAEGGCGALAPTLSDVTTIDTFYTNGAGLSTSGIDATASYRGDFGTRGTWGVGVTGSYVIDFETNDFFIGDDLVQPGFSAVGKLNYQTTAYPLPEIKLNGYLDAGWDRHNARLTVTHVEGYTDQRLTPGTPGHEIPSFTTLDFTLRIGLPAETDLTLSVLNLLDKDPGFAALDYSYDPFTANPLGRNFKIGIRKAF